VPDLVPIGLGALPEPLRVDTPGTWPPYQTPREHLDELLDLVAARAAKAITDNWNSGRLSVPAEDSHPFEREVNAILGRVGNFAADLLNESTERPLRDLGARRRAERGPALAARPCACRSSSCAGSSACPRSPPRC
jgi:hypothetical protein